MCVFGKLCIVHETPTGANEKRNHRNNVHFLELESSMNLGCIYYTHTHTKCPWQINPSIFIYLIAKFMVDLFHEKTVSFVWNAQAHTHISFGNRLIIGAYHAQKRQSKYN